MASKMGEKSANSTRAPNTSSVRFAPEQWTEEALEHSSDLLRRERRALDSCLEKLSDEHRKLVLLPYREPGGVAELAAQTNRSANSLYKLLGRLRYNLRHCVERELAAEGGQS